MRVLIAEDDDALRKRLVKTFQQALYIVDEAADGLEAQHLGEVEPYDAIVLDLGLPVVDGLTVLERWRAAGISAGVIVLTARDTWREKVIGLRAGADDYLTKPFHSEELLARVEALVRRTHQRAAAILEVGPFSIDPAARRVLRDGEEIELTAQEFRMLQYLALNAGRVVPQDELIQHIYAQEIELNSNVVEVIMSRIRKKLDAPLIETRRGLGYVIPTSA